MRRRPLALALASVLAMLVIASAEAGQPATTRRPAPAATPAAASAGPRPLTPTEQEWLAHAKRVDRDGWVHVRIAGGPRERGCQHGYLLAKEIDFEAGE